MPWYDGNIPTTFHDALERATGAKFGVKVIFDPDGLALELSGTHDLADMAEVSMERELDIEWAQRGIISDLQLTFNDPDNYFNPANEISPFYTCVAELDRDHLATATSIKLKGWPEVLFSANDVLTIDDGTNTEDITVNAFTAAAGATVYHDITFSAGLVNAYSADTRIFNEPNENKRVLVYITNLTETEEKEICVYQGRLVKNPECSSGKAVLTLADNRKLALESDLIGADSSAALKLMIVGTDGKLKSSINWSNNFNKPPLVWSISDGALPNGVTINTATGIVSGAPTATGTYTFTVMVTNADGESISQTCELIVYNWFNAEFETAYGLGDYTTRNTSATFSFDVSTLTDWCTFSYRIVTPLSDYLWYNDIGGLIDLPIQMYLTTETGKTGDYWTAIVDLDATNMGAEIDWNVGLYVRLSDDMGYQIGYYEDNSHISVWCVEDRTQYNTTAGQPSRLMFRIRKSLTGLWFDYKTPEATSWTNLRNETEATSVKDIGIGGCIGDGAGLPTSPMTGHVHYNFFRYYHGSIVIDTVNLPHSRVGDSYDFTLHTEGGRGEYVYAITSGILPLGLSLNTSTGNISGTPTSSGSFSFTIQVTDAVANTDTQDFTVEIDSTNEICPNYFPYAGHDVLHLRTYSLQMKSYIGGSLDRTQVIVYPGCRLGKWTITFTDANSFEIEGPRINKQTGTVSSDFTITNIIKIPSAAWTVGMSKDDVLTFYTGINFEEDYIVNILYDLLTVKAAISNIQLHCSSFFGDKNLGTLYAGASAGATSIIIAVKVPTLIKTGEILTLTQGVTTEKVTVTGGNAVSTSYPPYITLTVSALANTYTTAATVTWDQRAAVDTDFTFDKIYRYCELIDGKISITFDRDMTIAQALEAVGQHADIFTFHDFGVENLHALSPQRGTAIALTDAEIKMPEPTLSTVGLVNEIIVNWGYDYIEEKYAGKLIFPDPSDVNKSQLRHDVTISKEIFCPGHYTEAQAEALAARKYAFWENGLRVVEINLDFRALLLKLGEQISMNNDYPELVADAEIFSKRVRLTGNRNIVAKAFTTEVQKHFFRTDEGQLDSYQGLW